MKSLYCSPITYELQFYYGKTWHCWKGGIKTLKAVRALLAKCKKWYPSQKHRIVKWETKSKVIQGGKTP